MSIRCWSVPDVQFWCGTLAEARALWAHLGGVLVVDRYGTYGLVADLQTARNMSQQYDWRTVDAFEPKGWDMALQWEVVHDTNHVRATVGPLRLRVEPDVNNSTAKVLRYQAELTDAALNLLWEGRNFATMEEAKWALLAAIGVQAEHLVALMAQTAKTSDAAVFGKQLVYCLQHQKVHETGWCTVPVSDKVGLGIVIAAEGDRFRAFQEAAEKCRRLGLGLSSDQPQPLPSDPLPRMGGM